MIGVGDPILKLDGVKFGNRDDEITLTELHDSTSLMLVFLRHFG